MALTAGRINENLRKLRLRAGLTQKQVADHVGITKMAVSAWETGRNVPKTEDLPVLALFFDVSINDLFE